MRQRIRLRLEEELREKAGHSWWQEQLALFETAHIGTLHSFCLKLVRQHFYQLGLDPQLSVMPEEEARLLAEETLDALLQKHYERRSPGHRAVQQLIESQGRGSDQSIRALVLRLHHYTQTRPDPADWFQRQLPMFAAPQPLQWQAWLDAALADWRERWSSALEQNPENNEIADGCAAALESLPARPTRAEAVLAIDAISAAAKACP